jgi:pimeloyl-ACP methyl ester carboxylesterase
MFRIVLLISSFALVLSPVVRAAERLARENLMQFRTESGSVAPVQSMTDWQKRRAEILVGMKTIMGPLPGSEKRVPLDLKIVSETDCGSYVRREITFAAEPNARVPAFLLIPKAVLSGKQVAPGVLALMPTNNEKDVGYRAVVGLAGVKTRPGRNYGQELAERGCVVIVPPYPQLADYQPDLSALGYASGTMKAIWDNMRALDVLAATPGVSPRGFGAIGHSLGGHNAIYTAVFDDRIKSIVSSCGFDSFLDYYRERQAAVWKRGQGWTQDRYMPALAEYDGKLEAIPFDFHELIGALAPRAFLAIAPLHDANFKAQSVDRIIAAARPVYQLHGERDRLAVEHPDCAHDFPTEMRQKAYQWLERYLH